MLHSRLRATLLIAAVAPFIWNGGNPHAQPAQRRATTLAALIAYPGFYSGQPVVVRGTLATRDQAVLLSPTVDRSIPLIFSGPSPVDGPVEIRASFWDVGRLQRGDPRILTLGLDRLIPNGMQTEEWPRPGEIVALAVTSAMSVTPLEGPPSLRQIALDPTSHAGSRVTITGQFRGRNLYGDLPQGPGLSPWDFVLRSADSALWVTGLRPRGRGFNFSPTARVDTGAWMEVTGILRHEKGLVWIAGQQLALTKPTLEITNAETPPVPEMGAPPEVIFSDPIDGEAEVPQSAPIRLQFSRPMNSATFQGRVRWSFAAADSATTAPTTPLQPARDPQFKYDTAKRALEISLDLDGAAPYRSVVVELLDGIAAADGARLKPWTLRFSFGPQ